MSCIALKFIGQAPSMPFLDSLTPFKTLGEMIVQVRPAVEGGPSTIFVDASSKCYILGTLRQP